MTSDPRASRIGEIFSILQDGEPGPDLTTRLELCQEALGLMTADERLSPAGGWLEFETGKAYMRRQRPERHQDLGLAITAFTAALAVWTPESQLVNWASAQANLGGAYTDRHALTGDHADGQAAMAAYTTALSVISRKNYPVLWASLQNSLGTLHLQRLDGDRPQVIEEAVGCLQAAAAVRAQLPSPALWAETQVNLAAAYRERVEGDRSDNLEQSLACLEGALQALGEDPDPLRQGLIHIERSETLRFRMAGNWADNLEQAHASAQAAVQLIHREQDAVAWADARRELAHVLRRRDDGHRAENLEAAITGYRQALSVYGRSSTPLKWALASHELGRALMERGHGQRMTDIEEAREYLEGSVAVLGAADRAGPPHAAVLVSLGSVYLSRRRGSRADNAEAAWRYLSRARELAERLKLPPRTRAAGLNELGNAAMARITGNRGQHVEDAIACYELALELAGRREQAQLQARLLNNLAAAYAQREQGDHAGNIVQALQLYDELAAFRTREAAPLEWAETRNNIGTVLARNPGPAELGRWPEAARAFADALEVLRADGPAASVIMVGRNLGLLGVLRQQWPDAAEGYRAALDAAEARYRGSLLLEARYDELTEMTGLRAELAIALTRLARSSASHQAGNAPQSDALLRQAVTVIDGGRMRMLGELMEQDRDQLRRLEAERPDLYQAYVAAAGQLRALESEQWHTFQRL